MCHLHILVCSDALFIVHLSKRVQWSEINAKSDYFNLQRLHGLICNPLVGPKVLENGVQFPRPKCVLKNIG